MRLLTTLLLSCCMMQAQAQLDLGRLSRMSPEGVSVSEGNSVVFFKNGAEKFADVFRAVELARSTIHMEYFNFRDDSIANALYDALAVKASQGVKVRLIFDAFGNSSNDRPLTRSKIKELQQRGLEVHVFDRIRFPWVNHIPGRDHRKIVVIDGMTAYSGGMNVADYYIKGKPEFGEWRDVHFRVEGPAVADYQKIFLKFWNKATGQHVAGDSLYPDSRLRLAGYETLKPDTTATAGRKTIAVVNREPHSSPKIVRQTFVELLNKAERKVQVINPYFTLRRKVRKALQDLLDRGVELEIMVSEKSDIPITPRVVDYNVRKLQKRGAKVYYYTKGFHHSKIMMVDSCLCFVGSANLDSRSLYWDYECNALIMDSCSTHELQSIFDHDKRHDCLPLTDDYWRTRIRGRKFITWCYHFLQPFL